MGNGGSRSKPVVSCIGVNEQQPIANRCFRAPLAGVRFSQPARRQFIDFDDLCALFAGDIRRAIAGAIVDHDHFPRTWVVDVHHCRQELT